VLAVTATDAAAIPEPLARQLDVVVQVPALRHRSADVPPLAEHFARQAHNREVRFTPAAARAVHTYHCPGNVEQRRRTVRDAGTRSTVVDVKHLSPEVLCGSSCTLTLIEALERDEIARCLVEPGMTVTKAADALGISRATVYRRVARYGIRVPR
jgi:sigma-54 dependent transcriptional regulator, acetoin dehydrogenase operon transcriptional activator AcoR